MPADTSKYTKLRERKGHRKMADLQVLQPLDIDNQFCAVLSQREQVNIPNAFLFFLQAKGAHGSGGHCFHCTAREYVVSVGGRMKFASN